MSQPIRGAVVATTMKRPDMMQDNPKKSDYIKNNPYAGVTEAHNGMVASVVDGKPALVPLTSLTQLQAIVDELKSNGIERIKTVNGGYLTLFVGTQAEYEEYVAEHGDANLFAIFTDDNTKAEIENKLLSLQGSVEQLQDDVQAQANIVSKVTKEPHQDDMFSKVFPDHGYYYMALKKDRVVYSFGLVYWKAGLSMLLSSEYESNGVKTRVDAYVTAAGTIVFKENGVNINSTMGYTLIINYLGVTE